jgi:hypothetical protein
MADNIDVLLIKLAGRFFCLPLETAKHICPLPANFAIQGGGTDSHFVFENMPIPYVSLWNLFQLRSEYVEFEEIRTMLPQRRQDHIDWMNALEDAIVNRTPFTKARNPHECAFGKWYDSYQSNDTRIRGFMAQFNRPHRHIHSLADKLLTLVENGQRDEALHIFNETKNTTLTELLELFRFAEELFLGKLRPVAVILSEGHFTCALGTDGVQDIVSVSEDRIMQGTGVDTKTGSTFIMLDDHSLAPLISRQSIESYVNTGTYH